MLAEEIEAAAERQLRRAGIVAAALVAIEAVPSGIDMERDLGMRSAHLLHVGHRDALVGLAEVQHDRHARLLVGMRSDRPAIITDSGGDAAQPRRREISERAAPAIADDADLADLRRLVDRRLQIL